MLDLGLIDLGSLDLGSLNLELLDLDLFDLIDLMSCLLYLRNDLLIDLFWLKPPNWSILKLGIILWISFNIVLKILLKNI